MIDQLKIKIRSLTEDSSKSDVQAYTVTADDSSVSFIMIEPKILAITEVQLNEEALGSGQSSDYNSATNRITITADVVETDIITVYFTYYKDNSDAEIIGYIRSALCWISVLDYRDFEISDDETLIYPTPENKEGDLIAIIASILIKPNYSRYSLPNRTVVYPRTMDKDEKIRQLVYEYSKTDGYFSLLEIGEVD